MSIRLRLTLLYSFILALTMIVFGMVLYVIQSRSTYDTIRASLALQASGVVNNDRRTSRTPDGPSSLPITRGRWTQVRNPDGSIGARTPDLGDTILPLSEDGLHAVQKGASWLETTQVDGEDVLIFSQPQTGPGGQLVRIIQVAAPTSEREQTLSNLRWVLLGGGGLTIIVAFVIGWVLAGMALQPIHRITHTAQAIGMERDFNRRVDHTGPNDEIGQLATTFNGMLAELGSAYRQLESSLQTQRRFVADASHELRTPLTTIRGNLELFRRKPQMSESDQASAIADSIEETERLIRLVNNLLVLARADAGRILRSESVSIKPLIEEACRQAQLLAPERTIEFDSLPDAYIQGDADALKQILIILLDNAIVHTSSHAKISARVTTSNKQISIHIQDTGTGIPPEQLPHIFERFYQGDVSRTGNGTGLGLSIAQELVQAQSGTLTVASQWGQGSTFTITLPQVTS